MMQFIPRDATCVADTLAPAFCPTCGHEGTEQDMCTVHVDGTNATAVNEARNACPYREARIAGPGPQGLGRCFALGPCF